MTSILGYFFGKPVPSDSVSTCEDIVKTNVETEDWVIVEEDSQKIEVINYDDFESVEGSVASLVEFVPTLGSTVVDESTRARFQQFLQAHRPKSPIVSHSDFNSLMKFDKIDSTDDDMDTKYAIHSLGTLIDSFELYQSRILISDHTTPQSLEDSLGNVHDPVVEVIAINSAQPLSRKLVKKLANDRARSTIYSKPPMAMKTGPYAPRSSKRFSHRGQETRKHVSKPRN